VNAPKLRGIQYLAASPHLRHVARVGVRKNTTYIFESTGAVFTWELLLRLRLLQQLLLLSPTFREISQGETRFPG